MKKWFYKTVVASVAVLSLGVITPNHEIWHTLETANAQTITFQQEPSRNDLAEAIQLDQLILEEKEVAVDSLVSAAKEQAYLKFGTRIAPVIENDFEAIIFPKIEEAIAQTVARLDEYSLGALTITENPSGDYGEKIFNIRNTVTQKDIIRFHVRTENRPFEGYYYNFHYHTYEDRYLTHYDLGEIYWSKNMPPKWLS